jgi:DNA-directed RNA polymerase specialized sigma24 family protein
MPSSDSNKRLSQIMTLWSMVEQAHGPDADAATAARQRLLQRYGGAVKLYLLGAVRDPEAAEELTQEFALRLMDGKYRGADQGRGRFRIFVKGVLAHVIADFYRRQKARPRPLPLDGEEAPSPGQGPADPDPLFIESWRQAVLGRAWQSLEEVEAQTGKPYYTVLRLRADRPDLRSTELAEKLSVQLGKTISAAGVRQTLHRARDEFADLLLDEVVQTLGRSVEEDLEQELIELNLLKYCQAALDRRNGTASNTRPAENVEGDATPGPT